MQFLNTAQWPLYSRAHKTFPGQWVAVQTGCRHCMSGTPTRRVHWPECLDQLEKIKHNDTTLMLYTAEANSIDNCSKFVLLCYVRELEVLVQEIGILKTEVAQKEVKHNLKQLRLNLNVSKKDEEWGNCTKCEQYQEKSFPEFMDRFKGLIRKFNNANHDYLT
ncbi:interleukin-15 isoform X3 [Ascaphus truei]|uniref:interleukin-15 isoform X3 n=1 Tax=Ascaphus truei TaxID=8439 RepID=UPI003F590B21